MALSDTRWLSSCFANGNTTCSCVEPGTPSTTRPQPRRDPVPQYRAAYERILMISRTPWARLVVD